MRIIREDTVAVIIDIQERLFPHMADKEVLLKNTTVLINGLKILGIPMILTEQYPAGLGKTVAEISSLLAGNSPVEKIAFSCCDEPHFMKKLDSLHKKYVVLAGIETHVCVLQTCVDLAAKDYVPVLVADCVSSRKETDRQTATWRMQSEGAILTSYESLLFELCRVAGTEQFRGISKLVKES
jgi:nicotinamidase-related amidase